MKPLYYIAHTLVGWEEIWDTNKQIEANEIMS